jgi:hypothetical protein
VTEALEDFRRARFLEPNAFEIPFQEGVVWLASQPSLALGAWQEALRRGGAQRLEGFGQMLALATQQNPAVRHGLEQLAVASHDLALVYLQGVAGADFKSALHDLLARDPNLETFPSDEKERLFALWEERGDPEELIGATDAHPDWMKDGWRAIGRYHASKKRFRKAFEIVERFGNSPAMPQSTGESSIAQLEQAFQSRPDDYEIGYQLYREQMKTGRIDDALMTVRHFTERPDCPAYFRYLEAKAWGAKENWERGWNAWTAFENDRQKYDR